MTVKAIQDCLNAAPFRAFTLATASGEKYIVPHPDYAASAVTICGNPLLGQA